MLSHQPVLQLVLNNALWTSQNPQTAARDLGLTHAYWKVATCKNCFFLFGLQTMAENRVQ